MLMGAIQVKNVPDELHKRLRRRARDERMSIGQYVLRVLEHEPELPSRREWFAELDGREPVEGLDVLGELDAVRQERDEQLVERLRRR